MRFGFVLLVGAAGTQEILLPSTHEKASPSSTRSHHAVSQHHKELLVDAILGNLVMLQEATRWQECDSHVIVFCSPP